MAQIMSRNRMGITYLVKGSWVFDKLEGDMEDHQRVSAGDFEMTMQARTPQAAIELVVEQLSCDIRIHSVEVLE